MTHFTKTICAAALPLALALPAMAENHMQPLATALIAGSDGAIAGTATLAQTGSGMALLSLDINGVPDGPHAIHLHETGDCSSADFKSAGGHIADGKEHGILSQGGPHPGDLPNVTIGEDGILKAEYFLPGAVADLVLDADGAAFVMHAGADDYSSQPAGDAGGRIACGVFQKP
jgi:superoxide dismutase, Cu-Zn family